MEPSAGGVVKFGEDDKSPLLRAALKGWSDIEQSTKAGAQDDYWRQRSVDGLNRSFENATTDGATITINEEFLAEQKYLATGLQQGLWTGSKRLGAEKAYQQSQEIINAYNSVVTDYKGNQGYRRK